MLSLYFCCSSTRNTPGLCLEDSGGPVHTAELPGTSEGVSPSLKRPTAPNIIGITLPTKPTPETTLPALTDASHNFLAASVLLCASLLARGGLTGRSTGTARLGMPKQRHLAQTTSRCKKTCYSHPLLGPKPGKGDCSWDTQGCSRWTAWMRSEASPTAGQPRSSVTLRFALEYSCLLSGPALRAQKPVPAWIRSNTSAVWF